MMLKTVWLRAFSCIVLTSQVHSYPSKSKSVDIDSSGSSFITNSHDEEFGAKINIPRDYQFAYEVRDDKTTNFQNRVEVSKNGQLQGSYSHLAPDGVVRTVIYSDDGSTGYQVIMREVPTNITVVGSGLPGDPLLEGKSFSSQSGDFHSLLNLINLTEKFGDKKGTQFVFPSSSIEFPVFGSTSNSKTPSSSDESEDLRKGSSSSEITSGSIDEELKNSLNFGYKVNRNSGNTGHKTRIENSKYENSNSLAKFNIDNMVSVNGESAVFVSKDAFSKETNLNEPTGSLTETSEEASDQSQGSDGGIPVVVVDQAFLTALQSHGEMSTQKLVQAIQQAMEAAITPNLEKQEFQEHSDSSKVDNEVLMPSSVQPVITSDNNYDSTFKADTQELALQTGVPVIVLDKKVFDSLDKPGSTMTKQQFALGLQQALHSALESTASNRRHGTEVTNNGSLKKLKSNTELQNPISELKNPPYTYNNKIDLDVDRDDEYDDDDKSLPEGGIPVIALDKALFESLDGPGSSMNKQQLVQSIQEALQKAVSINTSRASKKYDKFLDKNKEHELNNNPKSTPINSEAKITPVVALNQHVFESLDAPGSAITRQKLVEEIQNALHSAMAMAINNNEAISETLENEIPKEKLLVSIDAKGAAFGSEKFRYSASDSEEEEEESLIKRLISSTASAALESNGMISDSTGMPFTIVQDKNQEDDKDQFINSEDDSSNIIPFDQEFFKSLEVPESTMNGKQFVLAMQQTLNSDRKSSSAEKAKKVSSDSIESNGGKIIHKQVHSDVSSTVENSENIKSGVVDGSISSNSGGGIPVIALGRDIFESLDAPGSTMNRQQFIQAIQQALQSALTSSTSVLKKNNSNSLETTESLGKGISNSASTNAIKSFTIVQENENKENDDDDHNIPVIVLDHKFHKSFESQANSENNHPIVLAMQQALRSTLRSSASNGKGQENGDFLIVADSEDEQGGFYPNTLNSNLNDVSTANDISDVTGGGIPVIALNKAHFESLDAHGSTMNRQQLIQAIQQAMDAALKSAVISKPISDNDRVINTEIKKTDDNTDTRLGKRFIFPSALGTTAQDESGEKQTTIIFENSADLGFKSFSNSMKDFLEIHNQVVKPIQKLDHT